MDEYTRDLFLLHAVPAMTGGDIRRAIARVGGRRGLPRSIRSDNGSEFVCEALTGWLKKAGSEPIPVSPGNPWQNGYIESFHSRLRDEFLERHEFESLADALARAAQLAGLPDPEGIRGIVREPAG